ncbi:conserved hypothetical protein [Candidatus Desulfosporosinus infrequens]|uniref:Uncharacterized protein n=1 Tax=Candidatus Desulfosporosinus infrequens TaxID=2043169 RepID=A0A2U3L199_9FIRM|nr:conserved hypothetical protein [Candidatus Desulfosporosinus infrequens]
MQVVNREDMKAIKILINEFLATTEVSKEGIPIEFLKYLRKMDKKIEDGVLFNELIDVIEQKSQGK